MDVFKRLSGFRLILTKKMVLLLLRALVLLIFTLIFLRRFGGFDFSMSVWLLLGLYTASLAVMAVVPGRMFGFGVFNAAITLVEVAFISVALFMIDLGRFDEFYFLFFFTLLISAIWHDFRGSYISALLGCLVYFAVLYNGGQEVTEDPDVLLRFPLLLVTGLFGGVMTRDVKESATRSAATTSRLALSERLRSIGLVAGGIAHHINNPNSAIASNLDFVQKSMARAGELAIGGCRDERQRAELEELLGDMREALKDSAGCSQRIRALTSVLKGISQFHGLDENVDIGKCIEAARNMVEILQPELTVSFYPESTPAIQGNKVMLRRLFYEILVWAADVLFREGAAKPSIRITAKPAAGGVEVEFIVESISLSPEELREIYAPRPVEEADASLHLGVGLDLCTALASIFGSELSVKNEEGAGVRIGVKLPIRPKKDPAYEKELS